MVFHHYIKICSHFKTVRHMPPVCRLEPILLSVKFFSFLIIDKFHTLIFLIIVFNLSKDMNILLGWRIMFPSLWLKYLPCLDTFVLTVVLTQFIYNGFKAFETFGMLVLSSKSLLKMIFGENILLQNFKKKAKFKTRIFIWN